MQILTLDIYCLKSPNQFLRIHLVLYCERKKRNTYLRLILCVRNVFFSRIFVLLRLYWTPTLRKALSKHFTRLLRHFLQCIIQLKSLNF